MKTLNLHEIQSIAGGAINRDQLKAQMYAAHASRMNEVNRRTSKQLKVASQQADRMKAKLKETLSPANIAKNIWKYTVG